MSTPARTGRPVSRADAKALASRLLDRAARAGDATNATLAEQLGVGQTRVRKLRSDDEGDCDAVPTIGDLLALDHDVAEHLLQMIVEERRRLHGDPPAITAERAAFGLLGASAAVNGALASALADGVIDNTEIPAIQKLLGELETRLCALGDRLSDRRYRK